MYSAWALFDMCVAPVLSNCCIYSVLVLLDICSAAELSNIYFDAKRLEYIYVEPPRTAYWSLPSKPYVAKTQQDMFWIW